MATTPPPAPTRGPATHEGVSRTPSLSLSCLDKIRQPDLTYAVAIPNTTMVLEPLIYLRRLASGLRTQKRERETLTLTLEKRSVKRGGLTFSSAPTHEDEVLGVAGTPIQSRVDLRRRPQQERRAMASGTVASHSTVARSPCGGRAHRRKGSPQRRRRALSLARRHSLDGWRETEMS
jgi:hypothetical protein